MKEREQILDLWREMSEQRSDGVLITVVKTLGSSYRRPGARLLLARGNRRVGSVSGGCLEEDLVRKAWWLTEKGPAVRCYDTNADGELNTAEQAISGFGLGCNGTIYLMMERVIAGQNAVLAALERVHRTRKTEWITHTLAPAVSIGSTVGKGRSASGELFIEAILPPLRLFVFGAGDDAVPLVDLGHLLGWQVSVFDGRADRVRPERFPKACRVALLDSAEGLECLQIDERTVAVIMTHSYLQDLHFIKRLAAQPLAYMGVLGPRSRSAQLFKDSGIDTGLPSLRTPVGLDIGAEGPEQVALSIISEIVASFNGRTGGSLHMREGSIHSGSPTHN